MNKEKDFVVIGNAIVRIDEIKHVVYDSQKLEVMISLMEDKSITFELENLEELKKTFEEACKDLT